METEAQEEAAARGHWPPAVPGVGSALSRACF